MVLKGSNIANEIEIATVGLHYYFASRAKLSSPDRRRVE
jgi:hypothetical protein